MSLNKAILLAIQLSDAGQPDDVSVTGDSVTLSWRATELSAEITLSGDASLTLKSLTGDSEMIEAALEAADCAHVAVGGIIEFGSAADLLMIIAGARA